MHVPATNDVISAMLHVNIDFKLLLFKSLDSLVRIRRGFNFENYRPRLDFLKLKNDIHKMGLLTF